jgi:hypothetical protein
LLEEYPQVSASSAAFLSALSGQKLFAVGNAYLLAALTANAQTLLTAKFAKVSQEFSKKIFKYFFASSAIFLDVLCG